MGLMGQSEPDIEAIRDRIKHDPLHVEDPLALTLFGHPPTTPDVCYECWTVTELFAGGMCWMCYPHKKPPLKRRRNGIK